MKRLKNLLIGLTLSVISLMLTLLLVEAVFRVFDIRGDYFSSRRDFTFFRSTFSASPYGSAPNAIIKSVYPSNPRNYFNANNAVAHEFNSVGWRDKEHSIAKPPETYRILGLGDSYLYGQGVKYEDICLSKLETYLSKSNKNKKLAIETINAGISGFNTGDERDQLSSRGLLYKPDLVIVHFVLNDVEQKTANDQQLVDFYKKYVSIVMKEDELSKISYFWSWARKRYQQQVEGNAYIRQCLDSYLTDQAKFAFVKDALSDIQRLCQENETKLLVVIFPFFYNLDSNYPFRPIHKYLQEFCEKQGIPVLDLLPFYSSYSGPELWVHEVDQHPNEIAHDIAAKAMFDYLLNNKAQFGIPF